MLTANERRAAYRSHTTMNRAELRDAFQVLANSTMTVEVDIGKSGLALLDALDKAEAALDRLLAVGDYEVILKGNALAAIRALDKVNP